MAVQLRDFSPSEIMITRDEAWAILKFFWPDTSLSVGDINAQDKNFAQGLLVEAIDRSYAMGYVNILFNTFYGKVAGSPIDVLKLVKTFAMKAAKHWFKHIGAHGLSKAEIYRTVQMTIAMNFKSMLAVRIATGDY